MKEFLNHYSEVAVGLEKISDYVQRLHKAMKAAQSEAKEAYATMKEFKKASEFNCARYYKAKDLLQEVVTGANGMCGLVDIELLTKIQHILENNGK